MPSRDAGDPGRTPATWMVRSLSTRKTKPKSLFWKYGQYPGNTANNSSNAILSDRQCALGAWACDILLADDQGHALKAKLVDHFHQRIATT